MLEILAFVMWTSFVAYVTWYFTSAKHNVPISLGEARVLWMIHKQDQNCNARRWREVKSKDQIVGFECECGFKHIQKRPLVASSPSVQTGSQACMPEGLSNTQR